VIVLYTADVVREKTKRKKEKKPLKTQEMLHFLKFKKGGENQHAIASTFNYNPADGDTQQGCLL
jgi:hypothetical protein